MKTHAKLSYMSRCYAALKVNQHFNHETKNDVFQELETSIFKKTIFADGMLITLHQRIIIRELYMHIKTSQSMIENIYMKINK